MSGFNKRKTEAEDRFKHDQDLEFKANARRNKLLGLWAAELMGMSSDDAVAYAKEVVVSDFDRPGDDDVREKVENDFVAKGLEVSDHRVRKEMDRLLEEARAQVRAE
ncbi:MAG: DUF1476 domain-containing protein [Alphaproteobacteria bacterium]